MAVLVSDSFNRANSTTSLGSTDSYNGGTATTYSKLGTAVFGINSNMAYTSTTGAESFSYVDCQNANVKVSITNGSVYGYLGLWFRIVDGNNYLRFYIKGSYIYLEKVVNGVVTSLSTISGYSRAVGDILSIITKNDGTIQTYVNGVLKNTITDSAFATSTLHGFGINNADPDARWDNFQIEDLNTGTSLSVNLSDTVSTVDSLTSSKSLYRSFSDMISTADSLVSNRSSHLSFSDSINSTDSLVSSKSLHISFSDTIGTTDSISNRISSVISLAKTVTDTISLTDSITVTKNKYLTLVDLFTLVDSIGIGGGVMSQVIQIRRGHEANLPVLNVGEPALTTDTQKMFIGTPNGNVEIPTLLVVSSVSSLPTPSVSNQWVLAGVKGGTGVADAMYMCKKLSNDTYDWVQFV